MPGTPFADIKRRKSMKKILVLILLVSTALLCGCSTGKEPTEEHTPSIHWRKDTTGKYLHDDAVKQIVTVQAPEGTEAVVKLFEKTTENGKTVWTETLTCPGIIGLAGLGKTKEGDNKTPIGDFGITTAFGIKENPGIALPYIDVDENTYCCGDENFYNQMIDISEHPHDCPDGEHIIDYSPEYNYGIFIDYNKEGTPGLGSAIFFHCTGANTYTGGCIAVSEENMVTILIALDANARIIIDYMP